MDDQSPNVSETLEVTGTKVLVAHYIYPSGVVPHVHSIVVAERNPEAVKYQHGAIGFDFAYLYQFICEDDVFQQFRRDPETYYWGQELTSGELAELNNYGSALSTMNCDRFVLTDWGAVLPLNDQDRVVPHPDAFVLPPDMHL